eukprot:5317688-Amphidinium_carterae.2
MSLLLQSDCPKVGVLVVRFTCRHIILMMLLAQSFKDRQYLDCLQLYGGGIVAAVVQTSLNSAVDPVMSHMATHRCGPIAAAR